MATEIGGYGTPVIYNLKDGYSLSTVQDMRKNDEELENYLPFTAVGSLDQQTFTNDDLGKTLTGTLTYIYGSSENLCSSDGELMEDDLTGCVLSSKAAWELFGESAITGGIVTYNEKSYYTEQHLTYNNKYEMNGNVKIEQTFIANGNNLEAVAIRI